MASVAKSLFGAVRGNNFKSIPRQLWFLYRKRGLRERLFQEYQTSTDPEVREVIRFLEANPSQELPIGMTPPYAWVQEYRPEDVIVEQDAETGMLFSRINGHRIFFPRTATPAGVQQSVCIARMEQDRRSPHAYVSGGHHVDRGDVAVFVGASDGIFSLSVMDSLAKAYLFEPDPAWHEPLRTTMKPWSNQIEIVPLALGSQDSEGTVRLDTFLAKRDQPNFIQMDVEGNEFHVLQGAEALLRNARKLRLSICAYHNRLDFPRFAEFLSGLQYTVNHSPGFYVLGVRMPYLRRGVLYASRGISS
jgi:Methyltransferase FkbM domain